MDESQLKKTGNNDEDIEGKDMVSQKDVLPQNNIESNIQSKKITRYDALYLDKSIDLTEKILTHSIFGQEYILYQKLMRDYPKSEYHWRMLDKGFTTAKAETRKTIEHVFEKTYTKGQIIVTKTIDHNYVLENLFFLNSFCNGSDMEEFHDIIHSSVPKSIITSIKSKNNRDLWTPEESIYFAMFPDDVISKVIFRDYFFKIKDDALEKILIQREKILKKVRLFSTQESLESFTTSYVKQFPEEYSSQLSAYGLNVEEIAKRLSRTTVILSDPLINKLGSNLGSFDAVTEKREVPSYSGKRIAFIGRRCDSCG